MAAIYSKGEKVSLELAVLRYKAVVGTASMNKNALCQGVTNALEAIIEVNRSAFEKAGVFTEKNNKAVNYIGNNFFICGWPMLAFDVKLIKKKLILSSNVHIRIYVASDMLRNAQVKCDTMQYCESNKIKVIDKLFKFYQSNSDETSADEEIFEEIRKHVSENNNSNNSSNSSSSCNGVKQHPTNSKKSSQMNGHNNQSSDPNGQTMSPTKSSNSRGPVTRSSAKSGGKL